MTRDLSLFELGSGGTFVDGDWVESKDQDPIGPVRLTQLADVGVASFRDRSDRWMRSDQAERLQCTFLEPDDILIARMPDPIARACLVPSALGRAVTAVDVAILRIKRTDVHPRYAMWMMNSPQFHAAATELQSGTTRKRISRKNLATLRVPIPSVRLQLRTVEILEDHLSRLDTADANLALVSRRLEGLRARSIQSAILGDLSPATRHEPSLAPAGTFDSHVVPLPAGWTWRRLGEIADVVGGVTKDGKKQSDPSYVEAPYLRVANVQRGNLALDDVVTLRVPPQKKAQLELKRGDVLLNEGGDRDKLARGWVWEGQIPGCIHQNHVFRARLREARISPYFVSFAANSLGGPWAERNGKQSVNLASISLSTIRKMPVPIPTGDESHLIASRLMDVLAELDRLGGAICLSRIRGVALRRAVLAAAFSGRLTGRRTDEEVIEEIAEARP